MAKNMIGIDMGRSRLKIALVNGKFVKKTVIADMPENMMRDGRIVSVDAMAQFIRETLRKSGIHGKNAAVVLSDEAVFARNVVMPVMTADQLRMNLPYECRDYISEDLDHYVFDYAMLTEEEEVKRKYEKKISGVDEEEGENLSMELMAVAVHKNVLEDVHVTLRKAGLRLESAAPEVCVYSDLIRSQENPHREYCLMDLGFGTIRMYMFKGECHNVTRELEAGLSVLAGIISDHYNVNVHQARTYLLTNHNNCQYHEACMEFYSRVAVELMRAVNFYQFSNPDSSLAEIYVSGGGAMLKPLMDSIRQTISLPIHFASELIQGKENAEECNAMIQAIGAALN